MPRLALLSFYDPANRLLTFNLAEAAGQQNVPCGHQRLEADIFEVDFPFLFELELKQHVGLFPLWAEVLLWDDDSGWNFYKQVLN